MKCIASKLKMVYFCILLTFVTALSIESSDSNLLKFEMYLKFQITKRRISTQPGERTWNGIRDKAATTLIFAYLLSVYFILSHKEPLQIKEHSYQ